MMRIGAFIKQSMVDWENMISAVVFTKGCNFRCSYCHNPELVVPGLLKLQSDIPEEVIISHLAARRHWLDGVVISGGEPTIQEDLEIFTTRIKEMDYPVKLDTNGSRPEVLKKLIDKKLIDFVAMDIKTIPEEEKYQTIARCSDPSLTGKIISSMEIIRASGIPYQFRTTTSALLHSPEDIRQLCGCFINDHYNLQECRLERTLSQFTGVDF